MKPREKRNPLQHNGLTRPERFLPELDPGYAKIDDRDIIDLMAFAYQYSRHLRYYESAEQGKGETVRETGTWQELLVNEQLFFLAVMAKRSPATFSHKFEKAAAGLTAEAQKDAYFAVAGMFTEVAQWARTLPKSSQGYQDTMVYVRQMETQAIQLLTLFQGSFPGDRDLWDHLASTLPGWHLGDPPEEIPMGIPGDGPVVDQNHQVRMLRRLFEAVQTVYSSIVLNARKIIDQDLNTPGHQAHVGLFLAFLHLFAHSLDQLNGFTGRHLDFYLKDILKLVPQDPTPDQVHLVFEAAKGIDRHELAAGTALKGGKDTDGTERIYELAENTVITRTTVESLKSLYVEFDRTTEPPALAGVHLGIAADSLDGQGEALKEDDPKWPGFGTPDYPFADLGIAVSSPVLRLTKGQRTIILEFFMDDIDGLKKTFAAEFPDESTLEVQLPALFSGQIYSDKGWFAATPDLFVETRDKKLVFRFELGMGDPGIVDYAPLESGDTPALPAAGPVIKLLLRQQAYPMALNLLRRIRITKLDLHVTVDNVTDLVVENDLSTQKPSKPFSPFGPLPRLGSKFHVGCREVFAKPLTEIRVAWDWVDPPEDLGTWFKSYTNEKFKYQADVQIRKDHQWTALADGTDLSEEADPSPSPAKILEALSLEELGIRDRVFKKIEPEKPQEGISQFKGEFTLPVTGYTADYDAEPFTGFSGTLGRGGIRFTLTQPGFAFGHKAHGRLHSKAVAASIADKDTTLLDELQLPYTPLFENLSLGYSAAHSFDLSMPQPDLDLIRLEPFGAAQNPDPMLLPDYDGEGYLFIGLKDLVPPQNLSLLVQFAEGSADPFISRPEKVQWACLTSSGWTDLTPREILGDATLGFLQSGMIAFSLPKEMTDKNSVMPAGLHWLRVKVSNNTAALNHLISIRAQAGRAVYRETGAPGTHLSTALPAASIGKFLVRNKAVKSVGQPFASFGGRPKEDLRAFRMRSSERMRHKNRGVTLWDYEHRVLDLFPEVHKVKCLNHTSPGSEARPGHVTLVLIPDLSNRNSRYPLRPAVPQSMLEKVEQAMEDLCSEQVTVHAVNPYYESIQVEGRVTFFPEYDLGLYQERLHKDIRNGLTPWLSGKADIHFGGRIHRSVILNLIEELPYVDYITDFSINHFAGPGDVRKDVEEVVAVTSRSILVSHNTHTIVGVKP